MTGARLEGQKSEIETAAKAAGLKCYADRNGLTARLYIQTELDPGEIIKAIKEAEESAKAKGQPKQK